MRVGVEVGGTFTDLVMVADGRIRVTKVPSTPARPDEGALAAIAAAEVDLSAVDDLVHGSTVATNAILERKGARICLFTTAGFRDVLFLQRHSRRRIYDLFYRKPEPVLHRRDIFEIDERMGPDGRAVRALDPATAESAIRAALAGGDYEAVAICFLNAYADPAHEAAVAQIVRRLRPELNVTCSHDVCREFREYERSSTTTLAAYVQPVIERYLNRFAAALKAGGHAGRFSVMQSNGGRLPADAMGRNAITSLFSGPAAGVIGAARMAARAGFTEVITLDMGGTSTDVCLVEGGRPSLIGETEIDGLPIKTPVIDIATVGAGGGSLIWIDDGGLMRVGPQSAGAEPGPACYGRGGTEPTVSDAAVVLGYFDPDYFLGGRMTLDKEAAKKAVAKVADRIGLSVEETAFRILTLASDLMIRAIHDITINEGFNPRESAIVAGGGAAGVNILPIAKELGCDNVILPKVASALSASGMQHADIVAEEAASYVTRSDRFDFDGVNATFAELDKRLNAFRDTLPKWDGQKVTYEYIAECRYLAQVWELDAPIGKSRFENQADLDAFVEAFHQIHERVFAMRDDGSPVEVVNWKARLIVSLASPPQESPKVAETKPDHPTLTRDCFFGTAEPVKTPIYKSMDLKPGDVVAGPAIIEEPTTTLVVYPEMSAKVSGAGNYLLR